MSRSILIAKAWPYANGPLHLGHIAGLIAADVLARYFRLNGDEVLFVSGTDSHGTPILNRALAENKSPSEIVSFYHQQFSDNFLKLGFTHSLYTKTMDQEHQVLVQEFFKKLYQDSWLYPKEVEQLFCENCQRFLVDRYVEGNCPNCQSSGARGDQCDTCGHTHEATELIHPKCKNCQSVAVIKTSQQLFFRLSALQEQLASLVKANLDTWRKNAVNTTMGWLKEGLTDRAVTRDLEWGIPVPIPGFENKVIYVWFEAVLGYLTTSIRYCGGNLKGGDWEKWWRSENNPRHYYVHGKDNIPFHTIIFPGMLQAYGNLALPTHIISSEYLQLPAGHKFSTSLGYGITLNEFIGLTEKTSGLTIDTLRFFLTANNPENKDAQFSWTELVSQHNGILVNKLSNFVYRIQKMTESYFLNQVPQASHATTNQAELLYLIEKTYRIVGNNLEKGQFRLASENLVNLINEANSLLTLEEPWQTIKTNNLQTASTLYICWQVIRNLANLLGPFTPLSVSKLLSLLGLEASQVQWSFAELKPGSQIFPIPYLFTKINRSDLPAD